MGSINTCGLLTKEMRELIDNPEFRIAIRAGDSLGKSSTLHFVFYSDFANFKTIVGTKNIICKVRSAELQRSFVK